MEQATLDRIDLFAVARFDELYHVGTMIAADKGRGGASLEGAGLSVSQHPDDWRRIARLGDAPTWRVARRDRLAGFATAPIVLLDAHRVTATGSELITEWAVSAGYATRRTLWRCNISSDPDDGWFTFTDRADAEAELAARRDDGDDVADLTPVDGVVATATLRARTTNPCDPAVVADLLLTVYAPDVLGLDGVWWDDRHDPAELSCPRGVIAPDRLAAMTATRCSSTGPAAV